MIFAGIAVALSLLSAALAQSTTPSATSSSASTQPTVDLGYEVHQGSVNSSGKYPYYNFTNIRYAAPPVGDLRFSAPIPPTTINRTLNNGGQQPIVCTQANPAWLLTAQKFLSGETVAQLLNESAAASSGTPSLSSIPAPVLGTSEDCLFLDVMVPESIYMSSMAQKARAQPVWPPRSHSSTGGAAVMVWIYGGGYTGGSKAGSGSPATLLARARDDGQPGVIYVAMNYRVGLYGFLSGPTFQENGTANAGLYDQRLALEWVQEYIHLFGGDKNKVTVFGESAGGGSIMHQITAYGGLKGKVPFQQAIVQSPGFIPIPGNAPQEDTFNKVLLYASVIGNKSITSLAQLRTLPSTILYYVNAAVVGTSPYGTFTFNPTVDGKFVPALPGSLLLHGQFDTTLKLMLGHNTNEGLLFTSPFIQNNTDFVTFVKTFIPTATQAVLDYITQTLYPPVSNATAGIYTTQLQRSSLYISEASFTCNTRFLDLAFKNQTYSYYFSVPPGLHGQDIAYTYFNGDTTTSDDGSPVNATVATALQDYLTSFAMTGSPNEPGAPYFPIYGSNSSTEVINALNLGSQIVDTVANDRCSWWQKALYF